MMEKNILLLLGIFLFCGCGSSRKVLKEYRAQKRHYYLVQGYRPVALSDKKTGAENPFPLSAYEKEKLLDSVAYVCRTYLEKYPDHNLDTWSKLSDKKTGAENPFPLSAYEKEKLLDSVAYVCRTYLEKYPDHNLDTWSKPDCEEDRGRESIPLVCIREGETFRQCGVRLPDVFGEISRP